MAHHRPATSSSATVLSSDRSSSPRCAIGSCGGRRPVLAGYVTVTGTTDRASPSQHRRHVSGEHTTHLRPRHMQNNLCRTGLAQSVSHSSVVILSNPIESSISISTCHDRECLSCRVQASGSRRSDQLAPPAYAVPVLARRAGLLCPRPRRLFGS